MIITRQNFLTDPSGRVTRYEYDNPGLGCKLVTPKPVRVIDPEGRITHFKFDKMNRLLRTTAPDGSVTRNEYNKRGDLIAVTDSIGNRTRFRYDGSQRMVREERPSIKTGLASEAKITTQVIEQHYDEASRLVRKELHLPSKVNGTNIGKLVTAIESAKKTADVGDRADKLRNQAYDDLNNGNYKAAEEGFRKAKELEQQKVKSAQKTLIKATETVVKPGLIGR